MDKYFVWMGPQAEVVKREVKRLFERGVPTPVPALFEDLFANDPLYVEMNETDGKKALETINAAKDLKTRLAEKDKVLKSLKKDQDAKMKTWKDKRDLHRKVKKTIPPLPKKKAKPKKETTK